MVLKGKKAFLTGGGGYVGSQLARHLEEHGYEVVVADVKFVDSISAAECDPKGLRVQVDVCNKNALLKAVGRFNPDIVFHIASYGMSGREQLNRKLIEAVNIQGTKNILQACKDNGVECLVYTSTYNVMFGGQVIENGDESLPYLPDHKHVDHYSCTKCIAEQEVMKCNGTPVKGGGALKVCALRLAGVYGEGEQRHLPRIVSMIESGLYVFTFGSLDSKVDFLHIDNLVQAHRLAGQALLAPEAPAAGQVYNISDGKPINNFAFFKPLVEGLGYSQPRICLPLWLVFYFACLTELVHGIVGRYVYNFQPLFTKAEVYKVGVTHHFSLDKAKRELGYMPEERNLQGVVAWFKERGHGRETSVARQPWSSNSCVNILLFLLIATAVAFLALSATVFS